MIWFGYKFQLKIKVKNENIKYIFFQTKSNCFFIIIILCFFCIDLHFILCVSIILINSMYYLIVNSEELDICDGSENMFINNPDPYSSCGSFILCTENGPQAPDVCPEGFYFNFKDQICDHPANVNCTEPIQCDDDTDVGFYMLPYSCTTYIWCFQGTRRTLNCAPGLHFDVELGMCNFADVVNCHRDLCVYAIPGDFIPSPNNCNEYI